MDTDMDGHGWEKGKLRAEADGAFMIRDFIFNHGWSLFPFKKDSRSWGMLFSKAEGGNAKGWKLQISNSKNQRKFEVQRSKRCSDVVAIREAADCQSAIQQAASLRYGAVGRRGGRGGKIMITLTT